MNLPFSEGQVVRYNPTRLQRLRGNSYPEILPSQPKPDFDEIIIRNSPCEIGKHLITCLAISRTHCTLSFYEGGAWLVTNKSTLRTAINGISLLVGETRAIFPQDTLELENSGYFKYSIHELCEEETGDVPLKKIKTEHHPCTECNDTPNQVDLSLVSQELKIVHDEMTDVLSRMSVLDREEQELREKLKKCTRRKAKVMEEFKVISTKTGALHKHLIGNHFDEGL
ncbi:hypothetical protein QAD02_019986 [Eretmocerus hayati]|uniref:Uncharacterized protein n=1 Tax=Eretmocerus hayati TaxID=131215 RepID=A0ACC2PLM8_9HYME|nr:hypothetical protein QAD02_019986 [Eretmocerus hayati]